MALLEKRKVRYWDGLTLVHILRKKETVDNEIRRQHIELFFQKTKVD